MSLESNQRFLRIAIAALLVSAIAATLWFAPSVKAVNTTLPDLPTAVTSGNSFSFTAQVDINANEQIPIVDLRLDITGPTPAFAVFTVNGTITSQSGHFVSIVPQVLPQFGYGYGIGTGFGYQNSGTGTFTGFFGYGYGYGSPTTFTQAKYLITISTSGMSAGSYQAQLAVNVTPAPNKFLSPQYSLTVVAAGGGAVVSFMPQPLPPLPTLPPTPTPTPTPPLTGTGIIGGIAPRDAQGKTIASSTFTSADGRVSFDIPAGTTARDASGNLLAGISLAPQSTPPPPPPGANIIGLPYELGPTGATFDIPLTLTFTYDPATLPAGVSQTSLTLAYYDTTSGQWITLPTSVDPVTHKVSAQVTHFTTFAIIASLPTVAPPPTTPIPAAPGGTNWLIIGVIIAILVIAAIILYFVLGRKRLAGG